MDQSGTYHPTGAGTSTLSEIGATRSTRVALRAASDTLISEEKD